MFYYYLRFIIPTDFKDVWAILSATNTKIINN